MTRRILTQKFIFFLFIVAIPLAVFSQEDLKVVWKKCLGGSGNDIARDVKRTKDGGYIVLGISDSNDGDVKGNHKYQDILVIKLTKDGEIEWQKSYGGSYQEFASIIIETLDGGYIIGGNTASKDGDIKVNASISTVTGLSVGAAWVIKISAAGEIQWERTFGGTAGALLSNLLEVKSGGYLLGCSTNSTDGDVTDNHSANTDIWIIKINNSGFIEWQKCYGGKGSEELKKMCFIDKDDFLLVGLAGSYDGDVKGKVVMTSTGRAKSVIWALKINTKGDILWSNTYDESKSENITDMITTNDAGIVLVGGYTGGWLRKIDRTSAVESQIKINRHLGTITSVQEGSNNYLITASARPDSRLDDKGKEISAYLLWIAETDLNGKITMEGYYGGIGMNIAVRAIYDGDNRNQFVLIGHTDAKNIDVIGNHGGLNDIWILKLERK